MNARLTNPVIVSWYLFVLFFVGVLAISTITAAPEVQGLVALTMFLCLACSLVAADLAICLQYCRRHGLGLGIFRHGACRRGYALTALVVTLILFACVGV